MRILGFDPGIRHLGVGLVEVGEKSMRLIQSDTIGVALKTDPARFAAYFCPRLRAYMRNADAVGAEAISWFTKNQERRRAGRGGSPTEVWVKVGVVNGIITAMAQECGIPIRTIHPPALKQVVTGARKGGKEPMMEMVKHLFPEFDGDNHAADAILAGLACWQPERITLGPGAAPQ